MNGSGRAGFDQHPIEDLELIRDGNFRAVFGAFNSMKNGAERDKHRKAKLDWVAYIGGNRESRQLMGDIVLTREDIGTKRVFSDGCVPTTWDIDLHYPDPKYKPAENYDPFISLCGF